MSAVMIRRRDAAQATLDHFSGRPFAWGGSDCARLIAWHLRRLGYKPGLSRGGPYKSALGAHRALARAGFASLDQWLEWMGLAPIPPAAAIVGDIVKGTGDDVFGALGVCLGNGRLLGYSEEAEGAVVMQAIDLAAAWRAEPR
ncbi:MULTISPECIES: DUF6950 family protein [Sphingomonadales]|nr:MULTISPECIES: hypothetical protein [Sphingomonas]AGH48774.1 hypothetical protein G432_05235 [Sphingomonas sp. MM-1]MDX3884022.1 hypothetical protein [Sphingomonas sp.]